MVTVSEKQSPPPPVVQTPPTGFAMATEQPTGTPGMVIPGSGSRNAKNLPLDNEGKRGWSHGLFDCFGECKAFCLACWCPCLLHAQNRRRLESLNVRGVPDPSRDRIVADDESLLYIFIEVACDMGWVMQIGTRKNIRQRYNIQGDGMSDCCAPFCCQACDLVQGHRELKLEEESFQLYGGGTVASLKEEREREKRAQTEGRAEA